MTDAHPRIVLGAVAGHKLRPADITVARHCTSGERKGLYFVRKWLANREAFNCDPRLGWAWDRWFVWEDA